jgi:prepilin peptidase CpaA
MPLTSGHAGGLILLARLVFVGFLVAAVVWDLRTRRIPNALSAALAVAGLGAAIAGVGAPGGLGAAVGALLVGFGIWFPFYLIGFVGAGDVKLLAAASAWLTPLGAVWAALAGAIIGSIVGVATYLWAHGLSITAFQFGRAMRQPSALGTPLPSARGRDARVPYAVSLAAGALLQAFVPAWHAWIS